MAIRLLRTLKMPSDLILILNPPFFIKMHVPYFAERFLNYNFLLIGRSALKCSMIFVATSCPRTVLLLVNINLRPKILGALYLFKYYALHIIRF